MQHQPRPLRWRSGLQGNGLKADAQCLYPLRIDIYVNISAALLPVYFSARRIGRGIQR